MFFHGVGGELAQADEEKDQREDENNLHVGRVLLGTWNYFNLMKCDTFYCVSINQDSPTFQYSKMSLLLRYYLDIVSFEVR